MPAPFQFSWKVTCHGFTTVKAKKSEYDQLSKHQVIFTPEGLITDDYAETYLAENFPTGLAPGRREYNPFDVNKLYDKFARLDLTEECIIDFADHYGFLGELIQISLAADHTRGRGEPLALWEKEILAMRGCINLWQAVQHWDVELLKKQIELEIPSKRTSIQLRSERAVAKWTYPIDCKAINFPSGGKNYNQGPFCIDILPSYCSQDDYREIALYLVHFMVNQELASSCYPPKLLFSAARGKYELSFTPRNLIGALWLQFASAIDDNREQRQCICGEWFEMERKSKKYCNTKCRVNNHRARKLQG